MNDKNRLTQDWYLKSVRLDCYKVVHSGTESLQKHSANFSIPFFADSWYGKKDREWTIYPVGRQNVNQTTKTELLKLSEMNDHEKHRSILKWIDSSETTEVEGFVIQQQKIEICNLQIVS